MSYRFYAFESHKFYSFEGFELRLTELQWKVLIGIYGGLSIREMANKVQTTPVSISSTVYNLKNKLGCKTRDELGKWYSKRRIQYYVHLRRNQWSQRK